VRQELQKMLESLLTRYAEDDSERDIALEAGRELDAAYERLTGGAR
jgi:hypothetical protein